MQREQHPSKVKGNKLYTKKKKKSIRIVRIETDRGTGRPGLFGSRVRGKRRYGQDGAVGGRGEGPRQRSGRKAPRANPVNYFSDRYAADTDSQNYLLCGAHGHREPRKLLNLVGKRGV